jgi:hypothetical protein
LYAYHIGNRIDDNIKKLEKIEGEKLLLEKMKSPHKVVNLSIYKLRKFIFKVLRRIFKL